MDVQTLINILAGFALSLMGWFAKAIWDAITELRNDLHDLEIEVPTHYIRRDEFQEAMTEIKQMLGKIFDKLDGKADR